MWVLHFCDGFLTFAGFVFVNPRSQLRHLRLDKMLRDGVFSLIFIFWNPKLGRRGFRRGISSTNFGFNNPNVPKSYLVIVPENKEQVREVKICCKNSGFETRVRSGGHDYEGLSYISYKPYFLVDLSNFRRIDVDVQGKTAWVEAGATLGELYYNIANKSKILAFPAGTCPSVGVGGHISGGGHGPLMRKYGLAADNVLDATILNVNGTILDRSSMGEDLLWVIRGGGAASFGGVLS
nr:berberine bridge enzyme-like 21 [Nicotiana tomentosiformis]